MTIASTSAACNRHNTPLLARICAFFTSCVEAKSRSGEVEAPRALSDEEPARRGLTPNGTVAHVFAGKLYR